MNTVFEDIWQRRIADNLEATEWSGTYSYSAGSYFKLPLAFAYEEGVSAYQQQFRDHFQEFLDTGFSSDAFFLHQSQYGHFASQFLVLETKLNGNTHLTTDLAEFLTALVYNEWSTNTITDIPDQDMIGREAVINYKLEHGDPPVYDRDFFLLSMGADLITYHAEAGLEIPQYLLDMQALAQRVVSEQGTFDEDNNWNFADDQWSEHSTYEFSDWNGEGDIPVGSEGNASGWDTSHASRFPSWLESFDRADKILDADSVFFEEISQGLSNQLANKVLYEADDVDGGWLSTNYLNGNDNLYRFGYSSFFENGGYYAGQSSGTLLSGRWSFLDDARITDVYSDLLSLGGFTPQMLNYFNEPIRIGGYENQFDWSEILESGDVRLWLGIAAGDTNLASVANYLVSDEDYRTVSVGGSISAVSLFQGADLTDGQVIEVVDIGTNPNTGYFTLNGTTLDAGIAHSVQVTDIDQLSYIAGADAGGDRIYWRVVEPDPTLWTSIDIARENQQGEVSHTRYAGEFGDTINVGSAITYSDEDGDEADYFQIWHDGTGQLGLRVDGVLVPTETRTTITPNQLNDLTADIDANIDYYIRANDSGDWSPWELLTFGAIKVAPELDIEDLSQTTSQWLKASDHFNFSDDDDDEFVSIQLWDDVGENSWWADGNMVDASSGYITTQVDNVWLRGDEEASNQTLCARGNDGTYWSDWTSFNFESESNSTSIVDISDVSTTSSKWTKLSDVISVEDADGDATTHLQLWDEEGRDSWWVDGRFIDAKTGYIAAYDANIWFQADQSSSQQTLWVRANDGKQWGTWDNFELTTIGNSKPQINVENQDLSSNEIISLADVFDFSDLDGDSINQVQIWDDQGIGNWLVEGQSVDASQGFSASDLSDVTLQRGDDSGSELLWVRVHDGFLWSAWESFDLL